MAKIRLENQKQEGYTLLPDEFTDKYMASANGEFVKVYICLLRLARRENSTLDISAMADLLSCTERDIRRALDYWAGKNLVSLSFSDGGELLSLSLCPFPGREGIPLPSSSGKNPADSGRKSSDCAGESGRHALTPERISELRQDQAIIQLLYVAEQYIGRPLSSNEMRRILYFYDGISMSPDLIQYLIEYCVSHGHKSIRYMETIALSWANEGISTVKEAQKSTEQYSRDYFSVLKAMGITGRSPIQEEISFINTWYNDYGFSPELIREACTRTVMQTGQASFQYADRILSDWKSHDVHSLSDVEKLDQLHKEKKEASSRKTATSARSNRFNNFPQRQYDFSEYEKKLVNHIG